MTMTFRPGDPVWWLRTEGGGGGSGRRPNRKTREPAAVVGIGNGRRVLIQPVPPSWRTEATWVDMVNLEPRDA